VICEIVFISNPYLNIFGAVISNAICYFISSAINIYYFKKHIHLNFSFYRVVVCPLVASISMSLVIMLSVLILQNFINYTLTILLSFVAGFIFYLALIFIMRTFTHQEQSSLFSFKKVKQKS
jgi:stage V sporulation protein B